MPWLTFWRRKPTSNDLRPAEAKSTGGRSFVRGVPYILPKDLGETHRLDFQHYMLRAFLRGNYMAPISKPRDILDVGCGTGRWAVDMATEFPQANVIGVDVSPPPIVEGSQTVAENYTFVQGNALERLPFADNSFDFVHQRYLTLAIPQARWPQVVRELLRVTRPGGWIELIETEPPVGSPVVDQLANWGKSLVAHRGIDMSMAREIGPLLQAAGAQNVTAQNMLIPVGKRGGRIGGMMTVDYLSALNAVRAPIAQLGIADEATFDAALAQARRDFDRQRFEQGVYIAYGQKV